MIKAGINISSKIEPVEPGSYDESGIWLIEILIGNLFIYLANSPVR